MRPHSGLLLLLLLLVACSPAADSAHAAPAVQAAGGCAGTRVLTGDAPPAWARAGFTATAGAWTLPWALASRGTVVAYLFARQLVAKGERPDGSANKILWVGRDAGGSMHVVAHPLAGTAPRVTIEDQMTNGNQMPSIVDLPQPGCWTFDVSWGTPAVRDSLSLQVLPAETSLPA